MWHNLSQNGVGCHASLSCWQRPLIASHAVSEYCVLVQIKGRMFENSFHPDPKVYLANQHIVFGAPIISAAAISAPAAS